jgi:hypothetical protein
LRSPANLGPWSFSQKFRRSSEASAPPGEANNKSQDLIGKNFSFRKIKFDLAIFNIPG